MAEARTGSTLPVDYKVGDTDANKIYSGDTLIWARPSSGTGNEPTSFSVSPPVGSPLSMTITERTNASACVDQLLIDLPSHSTHTSATYSLSVTGTGSHDDTPGASYTATLNDTGSLADLGNNTANWSVEYSHTSGNRTAGTWSMRFNPVEAASAVTNTGYGTFNWMNDVVSYGRFSGGSLSISVFGAGEMNTDFGWIAPSSPTGTITGYQIQYKGITSPTFDWTNFDNNTASVSGTSYTLLDSAPRYQHDHQYNFRIRALLSGSNSDWVEDPTTYTMQLATHAGSKTGIAHAYCDD